MEKRICSDGVILIGDVTEERMLYFTPALANRESNGGSADTWANAHGKGKRNDYPATKVRTILVIDNDIYDLFRRRTQDNPDVASTPEPAS